jgi:ribonucleoside-diphosphate reductase alpha chain
MKDVLANAGSARGLAKVPAKWQQIFATAMDISPEWHVRMQAAFQKHIDAQVSKTINLPKKATEQDVKDAYLLAYKLGCRGITVYRDGSRDDQVMNLGTSAKLSAPVPVPSTQATLPTIERTSAGKDVQGAAPAGVAVLKPRARPGVVSGTTQKIETGYGSLYVTINEDEHGLLEAFAQIGRGGGYTASFTEAVARLTSLALRSGIPVEEIIKQLEGIRSPKIAYDRREKIYSVPDAIAKALKRQVSGDLSTSIQARLDSVGLKSGAGAKPVVAPTRVETDTEADKELGDDEASAQLIVARGDNPECPDCGNMLSLQEGCIKCLSCGYSEC